MSVKFDVAKRKESERKEHSTKIVNNCRKTPQSIHRWQRVKKSNTGNGKMNKWKTERE